MKKNKLKAFSLAELMIFMLFLSIILAAVTPVLTKFKVSEAPQQAILPGTIVPFYGATAPKGWLLCNGSNFDQDEYKNLYSVLGSATTPDLRGRYIVGADATYMVDSYYDSKNKTHYHGVYSTNNIAPSHEYSEPRGLADSSNTGVPAEDHFYSDLSAIGNWVYYYKDGGGNQLMSEGRDATGTTTTDATDAHPVNFSLNYIIKT